MCSCHCVAPGDLRGPRYASEAGFAPLSSSARGPVAAQPGHVWVGRNEASSSARAPPAPVAPLPCTHRVASPLARSQARRGRAGLRDKWSVSALGGVGTPATHAELCPLGFTDCSQGLQPIWGKTFVFGKARARTVISGGRERETLRRVRRGRADCGLMPEHKTGHVHVSAHGSLRRNVPSGQ